MKRKAPVLDQPYVEDALMVTFAADLVDFPSVVDAFRAVWEQALGYLRAHPDAMPYAIGTEVVPRDACYLYLSFYEDDFTYDEAGPGGRAP